MTEISVGKLLDETARRDAIHFALAPVIANGDLYPGSRIGFIEGSRELVDMEGNCKEVIGVVDPFLPRHVSHGQRFWMFLLPNTVTGMRHQWQHPAFDEEPAAPNPKDDSRKWIEGFASELDQTYSRLMDAALAWAESEEYTYDNSETYKNVDYDKWPVFWAHYQIVTGQHVKCQESFFTCSC